MTLPPPIASFFDDRNARDFAAAASAFTPTAVVHDEGGDHVGPDAIRAWMEETTARYDHRTRVIDVRATDERTEVRAEVSGNFPGSPLPLRFAFTLDAGRIDRLEIGS